jgi:hypothetical protein
MKHLYFRKTGFLRARCSRQAFVCVTDSTEKQRNLAPCAQVDEYDPSEKRRMFHRERARPRMVQSRAQTACAAKSQMDTKQKALAEKWHFYRWHCMTLDN